MIIKCKMCGGDIAFNPGATYGTCEYCGSTSTIPQAEDEGKLNRYNRANHFRRQCEFDKALSAYEKILEQDDNDAEAHWGAALSRYGIEYVEDPATKKRIPTCHRLQVTSILADADYLAAVEHAPDAAARDLYKQQAAEIAEIQKGILAISANEKPYDVFICYKETDENGQRTRDSQWAQDVYYGLTEQGYKVFFSRITLEDKLGQQYEPYIFAALNSAKVMVVIGSKPEYFNAVWVKNEWSRYLALMASDRKRLLIPCYRGMDPYDLPEELSTLQSQDMGKIGFMQDLLRGVKKVLEADKKPEAAKPAHQAAPAAASDAAAPGVASLMGRTYLFMEDGDFNSAAEYLNRVLDIEPTYAPAYVAKACVAFGFRKETDLANATFDYDDNADWQKAMRFANAQQKATYEGYLAKVKERVARQIRNYDYDCAMEMAVKSNANHDKLLQEMATYRAMCKSSNKVRANGGRRVDSRANEAAFEKAVTANEPGEITEQGYKTAAAMFEAIPGEDCVNRAKQCRVLAEQARQKAIYLAATVAHQANKSNAMGLEKVAKDFLTVPNYKDAKAQAQQCLNEAEAIRDKLYQTALNAMKAAGQESHKWQDAKNKLAAKELNNYRDVEQLRTQAAKRYDECLAAEKEARRQQEEKDRRAAEAAAAKRKRMTILAAIVAVIAIAAFFVVTKVIIPGNNYKKATELLAAGQYGEAVTMFTELGDYKDAATQIGATYYAQGEALRKEGNWDGAVTAFTNAGNYSDAPTQIGVTCYAQGEALRNVSDWNGAVTAFTNAGSYSDAATQVTETHYQYAKVLLEQGSYDEAYAKFSSIKGYKDVDNLLATDHNLLAAAAAAAAAALDAAFQPGKYVSFGHYPQTTAGNDNTPIEWLVLARDGKKALLLSRYGLDAKPYNTQYTSITWEQCTLRKWLNNDFLNKAFSSQEQGAIVLTNVDNSKNQGYSKWSTNGGNNTQDKVFLLSYAEANKYLGVTHDDSKNTKSRVEPTAYAIKQGASTSSDYKTADGKAAGWWWLRSPGRYQNSAAHVRYDGSLRSSGVNYGLISVRPALWVNLESGIF